MASQDSRNKQNLLAIPETVKLNPHNLTKDMESLDLTHGPLHDDISVLRGKRECEKLSCAATSSSQRRRCRTMSASTSASVGLVHSVPGAAEMEDKSGGGATASTATRDSSFGTETVLRMCGTEPSTC